MNRKLIAGGLLALLCLAEHYWPEDMPMDTTLRSTSKITYTFKTVNYPHAPFTRLLGIDNEGKIVGYHGNGRAKLPNTFTLEDFPGAVATSAYGLFGVHLAGAVLSVSRGRILSWNAHSLTSPTSVRSGIATRER